MEHDNNIIIGEDFDPLLVAHALTNAYIEIETSETYKMMCGMTGAEPMKTKLVERFTLDELEAISKHIKTYVDMKRKDEWNKEQ